MFSLQVPDYLDYIKEPMDLSTMRHKAETHQYTHINQFEQDFNTMINNCMRYNAKDTMFYRAACRMRDQVIQASNLGYIESVVMECGTRIL